MILIKGHYTGWKEADEATAGKFVRHMLEGILVGDYAYKVEIIEKNHLRGATVKDVIDK